MNSNNKLNDVPSCKDCVHFLGMGDWNLCCTESHEGYPFGFLCYEDTPACEKFESLDTIEINMDEERKDRTYV